MAVCPAHFFLLVMAMKQWVGLALLWLSVPPTLALSRLYDKSCGNVFTFAFVACENIENGIAVLLRGNVVTVRGRQ